MALTRDAYYKHKKREEERTVNEFKALEKVKEIRMEQPRLGTRKLHSMLNTPEQGVKIGRDKLNEVLKERKLLVRRRKQGTRTTYSNHEYAVSPNRLRGLEIKHSNQVFVGDITYIRERSHFLYLFLITDYKSRKIVGHVLGRNLEHDWAIKALEMATKNVSKTGGIIFHSDRGSQYCCSKYKKMIKQKGMLSSMTDENHCYQNAIAERVNGILKDEYYIDKTFNSFDEAEKSVEQAVEMYNNKRPHRSLGMLCPADVYKEAA